MNLSNNEKIPGNWYPSDDGKGYSRYDPEHEAWLRAHRDEMERQYVYACYLYYHCGIESPLDDSEFDHIQVALEHQPQYWSNWFQTKMLESGLTKAALSKGHMKGLAHCIHFTEEEKQAAIKWAKGESNGLSKGLPEEEQEAGRTSSKVQDDL